MIPHQKLKSKKFLKYPNRIHPSFSTGSIPGICRERKQWQNFSYRTEQRRGRAGCPWGSPHRERAASSPPARPRLRRPSGATTATTIVGRGLGAGPREAAQGSAGPAPPAAPCVFPGPNKERWSRAAPPARRRWDGTAAAPPPSSGAARALRFAQAGPCAALR